MIVIPRLTDGLGNRLFQYACAKGLAERWHGTCAYSDDAIQPAASHPAPELRLLFPEPTVAAATTAATVICEAPADVYTYRPFPEQPPASVVRLDGFWQTERYFPQAGIPPPCWEAVLPALTQQALLEKYGLTTPAARTAAWFLHVRLGDYRQLPHYAINLQAYYSKCLDRVPRSAHIYLFSDEPALCANWIRLECSKRLLDFQVCSEPTALAELFLMTQMCGGAIVANSTFSWWGAYWAHAAAPDLHTAFYPSSWGQGMPPATDVVPSWGRRVRV